MSAFNWFARHGFDPERLKFGLRTALAACLALFVAWFLELEHPQWSAMTVWAASQPVRGMLIEKSFFRAVGTVIGTGFGVLLVLLSGGDTLLLVIGLTLWVGLCAGAGNALSGLISYGTLLAGYSASMVTLLNTADPEIGIFTLGIDRLLTVMTGVLVALAIGLTFSRLQEEDDVAERTRRVSALVLKHMAARLSQDHTLPTIDLDALLSEIAAIEETIEAHGAGSLRSRHSARSIRAMLSSLVSGILWLKHPATVSKGNEAIADSLAEAALALDASASPEETLASLNQAKAFCAIGSYLHDAISNIAGALEERYRFHATGSTDTAIIKRHFILHRDWVYARQTMFRTSSLLLLIGLTWVTTGWELGAYVLLGTSVMVTLFSTFENPARIMHNILIWQALGAAAALICRWLVWPSAISEVQMVLMMMPFIIVGVIPFAHRHTTLGSVDYTMILLLLLQPAYPAGGTLSGSFAIALAVVAGPLLAFIAFKLIFPADAKRRRDTLKMMMIHELQTMATGHREALHKQHIWRARLYHRIMKLVHWTNKTGEPARSAIDGSLAVLGIGNAILEMQQLLRDPTLSSRKTRAIQATLRKVTQIGTDPEATARSLKRLSRLVQRQDLSVANQIRYSADSLLTGLYFFHPGFKS